MLDLNLADGPAGDQNWWSIPMMVPVMTFRAVAAVARLLVEVPVKPYITVRLLKLYFRPNWLEAQSAVGVPATSKLALLKPPTMSNLPMGITALTAREEMLVTVGVATEVAMLVLVEVLWPLLMVAPNLMAPKL